MGAQGEPFGRGRRVSGRAQRILGRFPAHLEAARPDKRFGEVAAALARDLDVQSADLAAIRKAHRLGDAGQLADLLLIAGLHGIGRAELALLFLRFERGRTLLGRIAEAPDDAAREAAAEALIGLWGIDAPEPRLPLFAPPDPGGGAPAPGTALPRLSAEAADGLRPDRLHDALRGRIARIAARHAQGNGTVRALLEGAAIALDLDIERVVHSADRFWHAAVVRDRLALARPVLRPGSGGQPGSVVSEPLPAAEELLGIEENPVWRNATDPVPRRHGERFAVLRRGFERERLRIRVTGQADRTIGPMIVNRDEGHGVGFAGAVPAGEILEFTEEGRVLLGTADVTALAHSWQGACFAGEDLRPGADFVFDGPGADPARRARFVETLPAGALDRDAAFPQAGDGIAMPGVAIGETRMAFFVQQGHFSLREGPAEAFSVRRVAPRTGIAFAGGSVFAPAEEPAAELSLSWLEHRAFAVRLIIPARFRRMADDPEAGDTRQRVARAIDRFRPAGVAVAVDFIEEHWILGQAVLGGDGGTPGDPIDRLRSGTALWAGPQEAGG